MSAEELRQLQIGASPVEPPPGGPDAPPGPDAETVLEPDGALPEAPPELVAALAAMFKVFGGIACRRFEVEPLSEAECGMLGKSVGDVAVIYQPTLSPVLMRWLSLGLAVGMVAGPRAMQAAELRRRTVDAKAEPPEAAAPVSPVEPAPAGPYQPNPQPPPVPSAKPKSRRKA